MTSKPVRRNGASSSTSSRLWTAGLMTLPSR
jgi:hypothetical protein